MRTCGPNDASGVVWALFRLRGPLLAFVGYSTATVGLRGPAWAFVGRRWLLGVFVGLHCPSLAVGNGTGFSRGFPTLLLPNLFSQFWPKKYEKIRFREPFISSL